MLFSCLDLRIITARWAKERGMARRYFYESVIGNNPHFLLYSDDGDIVPFIKLPEFHGEEKPIFKREAMNDSLPT